MYTVCCRETAKQFNEHTLSPQDITDLNHVMLQLDPTASVLTFADLLEISKTAVMVFYRNEENRLIGTGLLVYQQQYMGRRGHIEDIVLDEPYRGRGLGKQMLLLLLEQGRTLGLQHIDLTSRPERTVANALYQSLGFVRRDTNVYRLVL